MQTECYAIMERETLALKREYWALGILGHKQRVSGFWYPRASLQTRALAFLISFLFLQPKLLDRLEFCRAVL